jgi:hypothetical protein
MKKYLIVLAVLALLGTKTYAREVTTCKPTTTTETQCHTDTENVCHMETTQESYVVHHDAVTTYGNWHDTDYCHPTSDVCRKEWDRYHYDYEHRTKTITPAWDETKYRDVENEVCEDVTNEYCEDVEVKGETCSTNQTFDKDLRCHAMKPSVQWAIKLPSEGGILATWSAMNGSEVEIQVSNDKGEWEYNYGISDNDGHEFLPNVGMSQLFRIRVINDCRVGDWLIDP